MNRKICPYLGQKDDPATALHFPSQGNFCHHARPVSGIKAAYQEKYCLTANHTSCPVYQAAFPVPLPAAIAGQVRTDPVSPRKLIATIGIPILVAGIAVGSFALTALASRLSDGVLIPNTGADRSSAQGWSLFTLTQPPQVSITQMPENQAIENCPLPSGWAPYIVAPTDSLYRLSIVYGIPVEQLRQVNCLGEETTILPGQAIYIPLLSTSTPVSTPTYLPVQPILVLNSGGDEDQERPQATPAPPKTAAPDTIVPTKPSTKQTQPPEVKPAKKTKVPKDNDGDDGKKGKGNDKKGKGNGKK